MCIRDSTVDGVPGDGVSEVGDATDAGDGDGADSDGAGDTLSLIHISEPTRPY